MHTLRAIAAASVKDISPLSEQRASGSLLVEAAVTEQISAVSKSTHQTIDNLE